MVKKITSILKIFLLFVIICLHLFLLFNKNLISYILFSSVLYILSYFWIRILFVIIDKQIKEKPIIDFMYLFCVLIADMGLFLIIYNKNFLFFSLFFLLAPFIVSQIYWVFKFIKKIYSKRKR